MPEGEHITMTNIFAYDFMIRAFIVAIVIGIITPCIGASVVLKRLSAIGDATSHSALAGICAGLLLNINPILGAVVFSIAAVLGIEGLRKVLKSYSEIAPVVIMSAGIGLSAVLSGFVKSAADLNGFLFGSIVSISDFELYMTIGLGIVVIAVTSLLYKELFYISFDEEAAELSGMPVKAINFVIMLLTAVTVAVASRAVGALMISSLLVIPVACAMTFAKSYASMLRISVIFALIFTIAGLFISFYMNLRPGGTIVLLGVITLIILLIANKGGKQ